MKKFILIAFLFVSVASSTFAITSSTSTYAAAADCSGKTAFLTFPAWYRGLAKSDGNGGCDIQSPDGTQTALTGFIWTIVLNVIDIALQLVGYIATFFIIYGGFLYLTSNGEASNITKAKTSILNAVIGLVISIASVSIVNLIFGIIN